MGWIKKTGDRRGAVFMRSGRLFCGHETANVTGEGEMALESRNEGIKELQNLI